LLKIFLLVLFLVTFPNFLYRFNFFNFGVIDHTAKYSKRKKNNETPIENPIILYFDCGGGGTFFAFLLSRENIKERYAKLLEKFICRFL